MAAARLRVPSSAHRCIPERSIQGTGTTLGHLAMVPGGMALVISDARQELRLDLPHPWFDLKAS